MVFLSKKTVRPIYIRHILYMRWPFVFVLLLMSCSKSQSKSDWTQWSESEDHKTYLESKIEKGSTESQFVARKSLLDYSVEQHTLAGTPFRSYISKGLYKCGSNLWSPVGVEYFSGSMATGKIMESHERTLNEAAENLLAFDVGSGTELAYKATCARVSQAK